MKLRSLGYRTDCIFTQFDGEIIDRGNYLVIKTPGNPNYFWGNFLLFDQTPKAGDFARWTELSKKELTDPRIYHRVFGWDTTDGSSGEVQDFLDAGFTLDRGVVLTAEKVHRPPKFNSSVVIKPIESDSEWERSIEIQVLCGAPSHSKVQREKFYRSQLGRYRKMREAGRGLWFGAYVDGQQAGCLGVFTDGQLGRFQMVSTHPDFQRQGICGSLVFETASYAFKRMGVRSLVMIADEDYHAAKIYESVGFAPTEKLSGVCWWDKSTILHESSDKVERKLSPPDRERDPGGEPAE